LRAVDPTGKKYDEERTEALLRKGIRIIRFSDYEIPRHPEALQQTIYRQLTEWPPPYPPPEYRGRE